MNKRLASGREVLSAVHTTPDSGMPISNRQDESAKVHRTNSEYLPRKKRAASNPRGPLTAAIEQTIVPKLIMIHGKYLLPLTVFMRRLDGMRRRVTIK